LMPVEKVSMHYLVPKHEIVPSEKVDEFLRKFGVEREAMPKILEKDPAAAEIGAKKGDIIKITRASHTAGESVYFRAVI